MQNLMLILNPLKKLKKTQAKKVKFSFSVYNFFGYFCTFFIGFELVIKFSCVLESYFFIYLRSGRLHFVKKVKIVVLQC
jgi:hypothetical protein